MVVLNKIYTKTGDDGTTALGTGERVRKDSLRVTAYGTVDEANAAIGIARLKLIDSAPETAAALLRIQNDLFDLGADLCVPDRGEELAWGPLRVSAAQVTRLENEIDAMNADMDPLQSFILPGGTPAAADLHLARTIARRAERAITELQAEPDEHVSKPCATYMNRLSDYLFVAARFVNDRGRSDVLWVKGENR
ncbi:MAG: cob(I)yrinic acid a,c-diamide adenosyltransferase [Pseudomonadota bacterium]